MENSFQTSFIPKKPIIANSAVSRNHSNTLSISMAVSIFILVVMILATGGLYVYKEYYLIKNKQILSENLKKIKDSFNSDTITELEMYDKRSTVVRQVLDTHIVLSPLFEKINELTLGSIQYTKFEHKISNNLFSVKMSGIANDYKSIALQADVFNTVNGIMLKDVIFSNLTKDKSNFVTFDVEFNVEPAFLSYTNNVIDMEAKSASPAETIENTDTTNTNTNTDTNIDSAPANVDQLLPATNNTP